MPLNMWIGFSHRTAISSTLAPQAIAARHCSSLQVSHSSPQLGAASTHPDAEPRQLHLCLVKIFIKPLIRRLQTQPANTPNVHCQLLQQRRHHHHQQQQQQQQQHQGDDKSPTAGSS
jgi:hypothetical protein